MKSWLEKIDIEMYRTFKTKPLNVKPSTHISLLKKLIIEILNLKLVELLEYQNIKTFLQKAIFQIGLKKIF